jgi:hypothetical protein
MKMTYLDNGHYRISPAGRGSIYLLPGQLSYLD